MRPRKEESVNSLPDVVFAVKSGAGSPIRIMRNER